MGARNERVKYGICGLERTFLKSIPAGNCVASLRRE
jgi:hypothetical protein